MCEKAELVKYRVIDGTLPGSFDEVKIIEVDELDTVLQSIESESYQI